MKWGKCRKVCAPKHLVSVTWHFFHEHLNVQNSTAILVKTSQSVHSAKKEIKNPVLVWRKGFTHKPLQRHAFKCCVTSPSPCSAQTWLAWAISCNWNLLFEQSFLKWENPEKWFATELPYHITSLRDDPLLMPLQSCSSLLGKLGKVSPLWIRSVPGGCGPYEALVGHWTGQATSALCKNRAGCAILTPTPLLPHTVLLFHFFLC